jgi:uncharacterized RDD family membrane protein YckC
MSEPMPPVRAEEATAPPDPEGRPLAGWGRRFAAYLLDGLFSLLVGLAVGTLAAAVLGFVVYLLAGEDAVDASIVAGAVVGYLVLLVVVGTYYTYLHGNERGQTWAKRLLGIRVRDEATGGRIGYGRAFARWILPLLFWNFFWIPGLLDGLWPLWDEKRQTWHDKIVRSIVVRG